ncbi:MAG: acetyl-CoA carboxylase biotin carboxylase subunit, partial [Nitrososphaerales archaeon]
LHLGERECSIQRRYQKLVEISPSPVVDEKTRELLARHAIAMAKAVKYSNAGTVEFLRDSGTGEFYFLEINSRLQVEHPVTELVTGVDLVANQIRIAQGKKLPLRQEEVKLRGAAIECRINSEDPLSDFEPVAGTVDYLRIPSGPGVRVDTMLYEGLEITPYYDSLLAKLISSGSSFEQARKREIIALNEFKIVGVKSTIPFHRQVMANQFFAKGELNTSFIDESGVMRKLSDEARQATLDSFAVVALLLSEKRFRNHIQSTAGSPRPQWEDVRKGGRFVDGL